MPPLQKQTVTAKLGPVDQFRNKKHLVPGQLTDAINVRQVNEFILGKRYGYSKFDRSASTGSITVGQELASDGSALAMLASGKIWSRSDSHAKWESRGNAERVTCIPSVAINGVNMTKTAIGYASLGGGLGYYYIAAEDHDIVGPGGYRYKIVDAVTGTVIVEGTGGGGVATELRWAKISATKFALFYSTGARAFSYDVFDPTNVTAAPTTNVLGNFTGGTSVLAQYDILETTSGLIAGVWSINGTVVAPTANTVALTTINSGTGLPGAWGGFNPGAILVPTGFARENGSNGGFLYIYVTDIAGNLQARKVDVGTFANPTTTTLGVVAGGVLTAVTGHKEVNGDLTTFYSQPGGASPEDGLLRRYTMTTAFAVTVATDQRATVLASTSFSLSMSLNGFYAAGQPWYVITQHDDNVNLQRAYQVRDSTGRIVAKFLYGLAAPYTQAFLTMPCIPPSLNRAVLGLGQNIGAASEFSASRVDVELAPTIGRATAYMGGRRLAWACGWPVRAGGTELLVSELGPSMYPRTVSVAEVVVGAGFGIPIGIYKFYATYAQYDADGNIVRSSPCAVVSYNLTNNLRNLDVTVPTYRITNDAPAFIELWVTLAGGTIPYLYKRIANSKTVDTALIRVLNSPAPAVGEILYTFGGEVSNDPPPPCRWSFEWQGRLFLGGTDARGEMWASKQYTAEHGPEFSLGLKFLVGAGTGDLTMGCALDDNYALIFRADAIFSISGAGPSNIGQGNYEPVCIEEGDGTTRPGSVVRGKDGVFYQGRDGGIWMIGHDRSRVYVGRGVDRETKNANVLASVHVPGSNQVRFFTDTGKVLVLDYAMPTDGQPQGSWYVWSSASLTSGYGACLLNGIEHHVESDGSVRKEIAGQWVDDVNTVILPKITIAPMAFGGVEAWQRVYKGQFLGDFRAAHHLQLTAVYDNGIATQVFADKSVAAAPEALEFRPSRQQLSALEVTIEQLDTGGGTGEGFTFEAIAFVVGIKPGLRRLPTASRL